MPFSVELKKIRFANKDTLRSLAEKIGVSHVYISQIEKGTTPPSKNFLEKILTVYPDDEKELIKSYLEDVLPEGVSQVMSSEENYLLKNKNEQRLLEHLLSQATSKERKDILELMLLQREMTARKNGTYEERKEELEKIKKEIENL